MDDNSVVVTFDRECDFCGAVLAWPYSVDLVRRSDVKACEDCQALINADDWAALKRRNEAA